MERREFLKHSGLVLAVAAVGMPGIGSAFDRASYEKLQPFHVHAVGIRRFGCARTLNDPAVALAWLSENQLNFA